MKLSTKDGRKYTMGLIILGIATVLVCIKVIDGSNWVTAVTIVAGIFGLSNTIGKFGGN